MRRREFITLAGGAATLSFAAQAQKAIPVVGVLGGGAADVNDPNMSAFRQGLAGLGYVEGRNILIEYRWADGKVERFPALATELAAQKVDVILTNGGTLAALAAKQATTTIPIVFGVVGDPIAEGLVTSLAQPGGNITGLSNVTNDMIGKWLELLKQVAPGVNLVAMLWKPDSMPDNAREVRLKEAHASAQALGVQLQVVEALAPADLDRAFLDIAAKGANALLVLTTPIFGLERQRIADLAAKSRLPAIYGSKNYVEADGLMSYGPNFADLHRRAASYVDKILKGTKPSDLPVEQPTKFEFVINRRAADALGLTLPPTLLTQADEVIE